MNSVAPARAATVVRTLLVTQFAFNVGFYAVVPFIALRLHDDLAASGTAIAVTLAVRTFSQQGMFVVGGALADRFGARRVMVAGTAVRAAGYLALAAAGTVPLVMAAAALTGIGGALFSPALESLLAGRGARVGAPSQDRLFALLAVCGEVGAVLGPVVGGMLLGHGFAAMAVAGAALFVLVGVGLFVVLPPGDRAAGPATAATGPSWRAALRHRGFVAFCLAYSSYLLSYNQLYVALPVELDRVGADDDALVTLFLIAAVLVVVGQLPVAAVTRRLPARVSLTVGFALTSAGFVTVAVAAPTAPGGALLAPAVGWVVLLTLGQMTVVPVAMARVASYAGHRASGAFYGLLATVGGVAVLLGSFVVGPFLDRARETGPAAGTAWWLMALFPALSAVAMAVLLRGRPTPAPENPCEPERNGTS